MESNERLIYLGDEDNFNIKVKVDFIDKENRIIWGGISITIKGELVGDIEEIDSISGNVLDTFIQLTKSAPIFPITNDINPELCYSFSNGVFRNTSAWDSYVDPYFVEIFNNLQIDAYDYLIFPNGTRCFDFLT